MESRDAEASGDKVVRVGSRAQNSGCYLYEKGYIVKYEVNIRKLGSSKLSKGRKEYTKESPSCEMY